MKKAVANKIVKALKAEFPGKKIICLPENESTEIICEIARDDRQSIAICYIEQSQAHVHARTTEVYIVESGCLHIVIDGEEHMYVTGDILIIKPGQVHYAYVIGDTNPVPRVKVIASPPWSPDDHHLVKK